MSLLITLVPIIILEIVFLIYLIAVYVLIAGLGLGALFGIIILPLPLLLMVAIDYVVLLIVIAGIIEKIAIKLQHLLG